MIDLNTVYLKDVLEGMTELEDDSIDLILTSPPYNLGKEYEKKTSLSDYLQWQKNLINHYYRILKHNGSLIYGEVSRKTLPLG